MLLIRQLPLVLATALAYYLAGRWGLRLGASFHTQISYLWPPSGLAFALLALTRQRVWPGVLLGALAINFHISGNLPLSVAIACGNTLAAWLPLFLLQRQAGGFEQRLDSIRSVAALIAFGGILGCAISALNGVTWLWLLHALQGNALGASFRTWLLGDATGLMVFAPLLLTIARSDRPWLPQGRVLELLGILLLLLLLCLALLLGISLSGREEQLLFLIFPILVWAGLRFSNREVALANFAMFLIVALAAELGVWDMHHADSLLMQLQLLFLSATMSGLLLAAALETRDRAVRKLAASERRYRQLSELSRDVISRHDPHGVFLFVSAACDAVFGYAPRELLGRGYCHFCHPEDVAAFRGHFAGIARGTTSGSCCIRFQHRLGHYIWLEITFNGVPQGDSGKPEVVLVARDITRRKIDDAELQESEERYRKLIELMPDALVLHKNGIIYFANSELMHMLEVAQLEPLIGRHVQEFLCSASRELSVQRLTSLECNQQLPCADMRLRLPDGRFKDIEVSSNSIRLWGDQYVITLVRDVSERKRAEAQQRLSAKVFEVAMEGIAILDRRFVPVSLNPAFESIFGYQLQQIQHEALPVLSLGLHDDAFFQGMRQKLIETGQWQGEMALRRGDGRVATELVSISCLFDEEGGASHYVAVFADISYLKEAEQRYRTRAEYDSLTRLPNRSLLHERLNQVLARSRRSGEKFVLMFIDLDGFKHINDTFGHAMGDMVLRTLAARLADCVRQNDTVSRLGGDEFVILMDGAQDMDTLLQSVERVIDTVQRPIRGNGPPIRVTASIGVALYPDDGDNIEALLRNADCAMYCAKRKGKNQFCFYADDAGSAGGGE